MPKLTKKAIRVWWTDGPTLIIEKLGFQKLLKQPGREGKLSCFLLQMLHNIVFLFADLINFRTFVRQIGCPNVSTIKCYLKKSNFVYHHWGYTSITRQLSYPCLWHFWYFRALNPYGDVHVFRMKLWAEHLK